MSREDVIQWIESQRIIGSSPRTIRLRLSVLRRYARELYLAHEISADCFERIRLIEYRASPSLVVRASLSRADASRMFAAAARSRPDLRGLRDRVMLWLLLGGGLRRSEARLVHWGSLRFLPRLAVEVEGKGGVNRTVILPLAAEETFRRFESELDQISGLSGHDKPRARILGRLHIASCSRPWFYPGMSAEGIRLRCQAIGRRAGLGPVRPHDLRRTFVRLADEGGASMSQIRLTVGHRSIQTTQGYLGGLDFDHPVADHIGIVAEVEP